MNLWAWFLELCLNIPKLFDCPKCLKTVITRHLNRVYAWIKPRLIKSLDLKFLGDSIYSIPKLTQFLRYTKTINLQRSFELKCYLTDSVFKKYKKTIFNFYIFTKKFIEAILDCKYKTSDNESIKVGSFLDIRHFAKISANYLMSQITKKR